MSTTQQQSTEPTDTEFVTVTRLELDVLAGLPAGLTWRGVAQSVSVLEDNAKWLGRRLYKKLGAANGTHAVAIAYESGLLPHRSADGQPTADVRMRPRRLTGGGHA